MQGDVSKKTAGFSVRDNQTVTLEKRQFASLSNTASAAQGAEVEQFSKASEIEGVESAKLLSDGSAELRMVDGNIQLVPAEYVNVVGDEILIAETAIEGLAAVSTGGGVSTGLLIGGLVVAGGVGIGVGLGGGGDDTPAPTPAPPAPPANSAPIVISGATASSAENAGGTAYLTIASDSDGDTLTYSLAGADAALFSIDASTGVVTFNSAPDFEAPGDADMDNDYEITVSVSDGALTTNQAVTVSVNNTTGVLSFDQDDFTQVNVFNEIASFSYNIVLVDELVAGTTYTNPDLVQIDYAVFGILNDPTPSGFPAFNLERTIIGDEFYTQGSSLSFTIDAAADLSDGLQVSELVGATLVFEFDGREVGTGRYHPSLLQLNEDGTGLLTNSNNMGGVNPGSMMVVNVAQGDEYIVDLNFDPAALTIGSDLELTA